MNDPDYRRPVPLDYQTPRGKSGMPYALQVVLGFAACFGIQCAIALSAAAWSAMPCGTIVFGWLLGACTLALLHRYGRGTGFTAGALAALVLSCLAFLVLAGIRF